MHQVDFSQTIDELSYQQIYIGEDSNGEISVGMTFPTKKAVQMALRKYCVKYNVDFLVHESEPAKFYGKCKLYGKGCNWKVRATLMKKTGVWQIRKFDAPHTCNVGRVTADHRQINSDFICERALNLVRDDPGVSVSALAASIRNECQFAPSYRKTWLGRKKAIKAVYGDWDASFAELPRWLLAMQAGMSGTIVQMETMPAYHPNGTVAEGYQSFCRLFWSFRSCVEGFAHCKPVVQVDGTHLYGKYSYTLLIAVAQDGNSNILRVAFALVEGETTDGWAFFLQNLHHYVTPQPNICVISDRASSIASAMEKIGWLPPIAYHVYCIRHVASNFNTKFKNKQLQKALTNAGTIIRLC